MVNKNIFRKYDIRGIVDVDLTEEVVETIGRAFGSRLRDDGGKTAVVGHDVRESSPGFADAFSRGLASTGLDVINVGEVATPVLYFAIFHHDADGGVMVTGSHNPVEYNGLKMCAGKWPIYGDQILELHDRIVNDRFSTGEGHIRQEAILDAYQEQLRQRFDSNLGAKVVVDAGNGTGGLFMPELLRSMGCEVEELFCEPDGTFPNHLPDPENPENVQDLIRRVAATGADLGLAFDGDSDRVGVIANTGEKINSDRLLLLFAKTYLAKHPGGKVIYDVKCSEILDPEIREANGEPIMWMTGHSLIKKKMREEDALLAGELSGHICVYKDYYGFDDAFFAALLTLQIRKDTGRSISELFADFPSTFTTHEIKVGCPDERKFDVVDDFLNDLKAEGNQVIDIDGARVIYPDGWSLTRASNTTPCLTLCFESRTQDGLVAVLKRTLEQLEGYDDLDLDTLRQVVDESQKEAAR